jgi:anti-sigma B factor antagonist
MTTAESTYVFADRVARFAVVRTVAQDEWRASVELCGELDIANAHQLVDELQMHLEAGRRVIRVDASQVGFMDSTAVGALVNASARCQEEHGSLILTGVPAQVRRLLQIAGLDQVLLVDTAYRG